MTGVSCLERVRENRRLGGAGVSRPRSSIDARGGGDEARLALLASGDEDAEGTSRGEKIDPSVAGAGAGSCTTPTMESLHSLVGVKYPAPRENSCVENDFSS